MGDAISSAVQQFTSSLPPEFQKAINAILSNNMGDYLAEAAKGWQQTGASQQGGMISGGNYGYLSSHSPALDAAGAKKKETINFAPGLPA